MTKKMKGPPLPAWFYLSFSGEGPGSFLGGIYVRGHDQLDAVRESHRLGQNPGGSVLMFGPIPAAHMRDKVPVADRERLLTAAELEAHGPMHRVR
ncbi:MAG: hypothetical protein ABW167_07620 [Baekduia sp.]